MKTSIEIIPKYEIAYLRQTGPYGDGNIQTMEKLKSWAESMNLLNTDSIILGIAQDNPETTRPEDCRYDVCLVISDNYCISDGYVLRGKVNGGKYAVFEIEHTAEAVQKAWSELFEELKTQGYQIDYSKPIVERYAVKMINNHKCEICVPIF